MVQISDEVLYGPRRNEEPIGYSPEFRADLTRKRTFWDLGLFREFMRKTGWPVPEKAIMLDVHGNSLDGRIVYSEGIQGRIRYLEEWVDSHDGLADALFAIVCNLGNANILPYFQPKNSFLAYTLGEDMVPGHVYHASLGVRIKTVQLVPPRTFKGPFPQDYKPLEGMIK